jgi:hypothetical protein
MKRSPTYDDHSSGSERKSSSSMGKKRPSRAGTRSVTTLTAAQLERKRANDREAQRAIRQRTKDHIEQLERQVRDLTTQLDTNGSGKMMEVLRRNDELEQENAVLRARLSHAVQALGMPEGSGTSLSLLHSTTRAHRYPPQNCWQSLFMFLRPDRCRLTEHLLLLFSYCFAAVSGDAQRLRPESPKIRRPLRHLVSDAQYKDTEANFHRGCAVTKRQDSDYEPAAPVFYRHSEKCAFSTRDHDDSCPAANTLAAPARLSLQHAFTTY